MTEFYKNQDRTLFGTQIYNHNTKEVGLLLFTWTNTFADGEVEFATCVDKNGKRYNVEMDNITPLENLDKKEMKELNI